MFTNDESEYQEPELSQEQSILFTRLQRHAVPIVRARHDATKELGLVDVVEGLYKEMTLKQSGGLDPTSVKEWNGLVRNWAELMSKLDAWIVEECKRARLLVYGMNLPLSPSSVAMPVPSGLFHTHELDIDKGTLLGEHWSFTDLRVVFATVLEPRQRELIEDGLWTFGCWLANERMEAARKDDEATGPREAPAQAKKKAGGGRPPKQRQLVQAWLQGLKAEDQLPKTVQGARARALMHFGPEVERGEIHVRSIYRALDLFYSGAKKDAPGQF